MRAFFALIALSMVGTVCGCEGEGPPAVGAATDSAPGLAVVGRLQTRNYIVTMSAGPEEVLYTVSSLDGSVLAHELTLGRLRAEHPQAYESLNGMVAEGQDAPWVGVPMTPRDLEADLFSP